MARSGGPCKIFGHTGKFLDTALSPWASGPARVLTLPLNAATGVFAPRRTACPRGAEVRRRSLVLWSPSSLSAAVQTAQNPI